MPSGSACFILEWRNVLLFLACLNVLLILEWPSVLLIPEWLNVLLILAARQQPLEPLCNHTSQAP